MSHVPLSGVNLGGWFVIERWMTPSLFVGTSARNEYELSGSQKGRRRIRQHHKSFITRSDLEWLKEQGVTFLRVPIGHWTLGGDERYVSAAERLDWLMEQAQILGFRVLLDLHAAPGAQNRAEHSGSGNTQSDPDSRRWLKDQKAQQDTIDVLCAIARRYDDFPNLWGIQLLNEPSVDLLGLRLAWFYRRAYRAVTAVARPGTRIVFSDGYAPIRLTNCLWLQRNADFPAVMDCHIYQVFGSVNKRRTFAGHIRQLEWVRRFLRILSWQQPVIVGEWSAMLPRPTTPNETATYVAAQRRAFAPALAQAYWSYRTESEGRWNFHDQAEKGLIQ